MMSGLTIRELSQSSLEDFLSFFDNDAFADNPDWASCYCMFYHFGGTGKEWGESTATANRRLMSSLISEGKIQGLLAYDDGKTVAWCNAGPRTNYAALKRVLKLPADGSEHVGSIVCFVVAPSYRRNKVASRLLEAACERFARHGLQFAEAYPIKDYESAADNFPGPLSMYLKAGFTPLHETESYLVVRKELASSNRNQTERTV